jgi:hypothetical protein
MDIFDQVVKLLKDIEIQEKKRKTEFQSVRALLLADLFKQYKRYVAKEQWKSAHDCLLDMITLFTAIIVKPDDASPKK